MKGVAGGTYRTKHADAARHYYTTTYIDTHTHIDMQTCTRVGRFHEGKARWDVQLEITREVVAVKPCNLTFVSRAAQSPAEASQDPVCKVPSLVAGAFAELHSLTREWRPLNGAHCELLEYGRASSKWNVRICQNGQKQTGRKLYVHPKNLTLVQAPYRFTINTVVYCCCSEPFIWEKGRVVQTHWEDDDGNFHPYQIRLDYGKLIYAPFDNNVTIRSFESEPLTPEQ